MYVGISLFLALFLLTSAAWAQTWNPGTYSIEFTSDQDDEDMLRIKIHDECARLIASAQPIQNYCTQNAAPDEANCTCTPNANQKGNFLRQEYINRGLREDRRRLRQARGQEIGPLYREANKATRNQVDAIFGLPPLP
jgi:hypothetical protein